MADEIPVKEVRRVIVEIGMKTPEWQAQEALLQRELVQIVRDELIKMGARNPDIFGGRA